MLPRGPHIRSLDTKITVHRAGRSLESPDWIAVSRPASGSVRNVSRRDPTFLPFQNRTRAATQAEHDGCALPDQRPRESREFKPSAGAAEERTPPGFQRIPSVRGLRVARRVGTLIERKSAWGWAPGRISLVRGLPRRGSRR
ncbi:uncharacterized protein LAESUDRAFT_415387 [Laetiporus sulphureus 93-53]|uniref:Uncharacterized protein n=1 Tax=Laetiporus sulphureus 93-53 TaxID=1314785 RepID=A0A165C8L6_9APHY|nr:uncharacterized protein LAESUDRAFT_415387 [Laetiporus sulphureus 93-53]KZT02393.1 hypothetical protein LAESUDRAFT_415387 [Laetiporus sulphureus 93-53]